MRYIHEALDDPRVEKVVCMKSAQIAWTDGVLLNYLGRRIDIDPCAMIVMFSRDRAAKEFNDEKFVPMVEVTPRLLEKIPVRKSRDKDNRSEFKNFPGGFLKFVGSNSPAAVKSTPAAVVCVEEPDDCNENVQDQGDTITLLEERTKTFPRRKMLLGGTPTIKGLSRIEGAYLGSDQRAFMVPCHHCGEAHVLDWANVTWLEDPAITHEVFGHAKPDTAVYACPHCGGTWNNREKNRNVQRLYPEARAAFHGVAGFYINELYSPFAGSALSDLVKKYLTAQHLLEQGDDTKRRAFVNSSLGIAYEYASGLPDTESLAKRAERYAELSVPHGAWILTFGADVQHDRIALVIRAWGRGEESWLVSWEEFFGPTMISYAPNAQGEQVLHGAWIDFHARVTQSFAHACGALVRIRAGSIDSSDGQTSDAVYTYVRKHLARGIMAVKGDSHDMEGKREIFTPPKSAVDTDAKNTKAHKFGIRPFIVGTARAKDLILGADEKAGRIKLGGQGPGRMHTYQGVRADYWEQLIAEVKAPSKTRRGKRTWQQKSGVRNEALDCEVYALHAARSLKLHLWREDRWNQEEQKLKQADLLPPSDSPTELEHPSGAAESPGPQNSAPTPPKPASRGLFNVRKPGGFSSTSW